jgi:hypothetical protein
MNSFIVVIVCLIVVTLTECKTNLSDHEQMLSDLWDEHCKFEFDPAFKSTSKTMDTMTTNPYVNHIPTMIGGYGKKAVFDFYDQHFIFSNPSIELVTVSRTIGKNQLVDELIVKLVHDRYIDWVLPGVEPTGLPIEFPLVAIVRFEMVVEDGAEVWKLKHEHIYWDQATVLVQIGINAIKVVVIIYILPFHTCLILSVLFELLYVICLPI